MESTQPFLLFLNAKAKETVDDVFMSCFRYRYESVPLRIKKNWVAELECSADEMNSLITSTTSLIRICLLDNKVPSDVLPSDFHAQLAKMFDKIVRSRYTLWRQHCLTDQLAPSRLVSFDWRVDTKIASNNLNKMTASSLLLSLKIQETPLQRGVMPEIKNVQLELGPQEINTLLDGLNKIKDQLALIQ